MDLGLSDDPYKSFEMFQGRIREEYLSIVGECGLQVIDATLPISMQQAQVRDFVQKHIKGCLRTPTIPYGELAAKGDVTGRYLGEISEEWRHG
jgi:hypothetical protein